MLRWLNLLITFNDYYRKTNKQMNKQKNSLTQTGSASVFRYALSISWKQIISGILSFLKAYRYMENVYWGMLCKLFRYNGLLVPPWPTLSLLKYFDKLHLLHPDAELLLAKGLIKWSKPVINFCRDSKVTFTLHASIIKANDKHITTSKLNSFLYS